MSNDITPPLTVGEMMESVIIKGDLAKMLPQERANYYNMVCQSIGLNPLTRPFEYITLNGKLTLYARKDATEQLRKIYGVGITRLDKETIEGVFCVSAYATDREGRMDSDIGAVNIQGLKGEGLANAMMKAITKAKRRVTLSICGLGMLDESEVDSIPNAMPYVEATEVRALPTPSVDVVMATNEQKSKIYHLYRAAHPNQPADSEAISSAINAYVAQEVKVPSPLTYEGAVEVIDRLNDDISKLQTLPT